jgi:hypothetical protein
MAIAMDSCLLGDNVGIRIDQRRDVRGHISDRLLYGLR